MYRLLFVDDDVASAEEYAEQVELFTRVRAKVVGTRKDAVNALRKFPIEVVILDQRMPDVRGTALFDEMRVISPGLRAIMLSGEAEASEVGDAINKGFSRYLHKADISKLPRAVLDEIIKYRTQKARELDWQPVLLYKYRAWWGIKGSIIYKLDSIFVEDETFVPEDGWKIIEQINCGEKRTVTERIEVKADLQFDQEIETNISTNFEIAAKAVSSIKQNMSQTLKVKLAARQVLSESQSREVKRELSLAAEPADPTSNFVRSRSFYWAPTYMKVQCMISKEVKPLGETTYVGLSILIPKREIATKQRDVLNSGKVVEIITDMFVL